MSFKVLDREAIEIHIKDKVSYFIENHMGEEHEEIGIVIALLPSGFIEVQNENGGVPILINSMDCKILESLILDILSLQTCEEFQNAMLQAEERYRKEVANMKEKKGKINPTGTAKVPKQKKEKVAKQEMMEMEIDL